MNVHRRLDRIINLLEATTRTPKPRTAMGKRLLDASGRKSRGGDEAAEALMRSKIELIRRADEVRQSKSEALARLLGSYPPSEDGQISIPETLRTTIGLMVKEREVALEQWLNAYEDACGEFVAGHIKSALFKASLGTEVRELIELEGPHHERLLPRDDSPYRSIHAAYDLLRAADVKAQK